MRVPRVFGDLSSISRETEMEKERRRDRETEHRNNFSSFMT